MKSANPTIPTASYNPKLTHNPKDSYIPVSKGSKKARQCALPLGNRRSADDDKVKSSFIDGVLNRLRSSVSEGESL